MKRLFILILIVYFFSVSCLLAEISLFTLKGFVKLEKTSLFTKIPKKYTVNDRIVYVEQKTGLAFQKLVDEASKYNISLFILSGARTFFYQKNIWEKKYKKMITSLTSDEVVQSILQYSAAPGTSRHHWGTDIDISFRKDGQGMLQNKTFSTGVGGQVYAWLQKYAANYGFCQPYQTSKSNKRAYLEERWHWSYQPIAKKYLERYMQKIQVLVPKGFLGDKYMKKYYIDYVRNIHTSCK